MTAETRGVRRGDAHRGSLALQRLTKSYGDLEAVQGVSIQVEPGEFFSLLGPSGCGKSTTLMCIAGFETPDSGAVVVAGEDVTRLPPERRGMGVVFQDYALFPHMTVLENVLFPLRMRGRSHHEALGRAREALEQVRLPEEAYSTPPATLSGGQRQRVALARAIVFDPWVLLMDEPLAALDRRLRQEMQFELREISQNLGTTIVYVTHDQEEALVLSDRVAVMRSGIIEQVAKPSEVYGEPANSFVASFLGDSNTLGVRVVGETTGSEVTISVHDPAMARVRRARCNAWSGGGTGVLTIRPENIRVAEALCAVDEMQTAPAMIRDIAFLGEKVRIGVNLLNRQETPWTVTLHPREAASRERWLHPGSRCLLVWDAKDARLVDE